MKKPLLFWQTLGFIFTGIAGVALHFLFDLKNQSVFVAPFSAVNESIWEHMKILFFPMFLFAIIESWFIRKEYKNFWCAKLIGIAFGVVFIPVLYYTVNGIFGPTPDFVNIAIFYAAAAFSYILETWLMKNEITDCESSKISVGILVLIAMLFAVLTFIPPQIPLFEDPITNTCGYYRVK